MVRPGFITVILTLALLEASFAAQPTILNLGEYYDYEKISKNISVQLSDNTRMPKLFLDCSCIDGQISNFKDGIAVVEFKRNPSFLLSKRNFRATAIFSDNTKVSIQFAIQPSLSIEVDHDSDQESRLSFKILSISPLVFDNPTVEISSRYLNVVTTENSGKLIEGFVGIRTGTIISSSHSAGLLKVSSSLWPAGYNPEMPVTLSPTRQLSVDPPEINLGILKEGEKFTKTVIVRSDRVGFVLTGATSDAGKTSIRLRSPGCWELTVSGIVPKNIHGAFLRSINCETSGNIPRFTIGIIGAIERQTGCCG